MEVPWKQPQGVAPTETTRVHGGDPVHMDMPWKQPQGVAPTETA